MKSLPVKRAAKAAAVLFVIFAVFFAAACAKPPTEEMDAAASAVTRAENDPDAVTYAAGTLARARDALNRMRTEAEARRYDAAKTFAAEAASAAEKAIADGRTGAERAGEDAANLVAGLKDSVSGTESSIRAAKRAGNLQVDFNAVDQDFETARRTADQAEVSLAGGNYADALEKGRSARGILGDIDARLSSAATAVSRKK
ncbi:MAG: DUF4398 domain-containing protein [Treponema sp.]|jgi:flagellar biosynthesis/type III secretory pathway protein FliH|nr:DUF4398 domain-containing protein [Treponema sp.]